SATVSHHDEIVAPRTAALITGPLLSLLGTTTPAVLPVALSSFAHAASPSRRDDSRPWRERSCTCRLRVGRRVGLLRSSNFERKARRLRPHAIMPIARRSAIASAGSPFDRDGAAPSRCCFSGLQQRLAVELGG